MPRTITCSPPPKTENKGNKVKLALRIALIPVLLLVVACVIGIPKMQSNRKIGRAQVRLESKLKGYFKYPASCEFVYNKRWINKSDTDRVCFDCKVLAPNAFGVKQEFKVSACVDLKQNNFTYIFLDGTSINE